MFPYIIIIIISVAALYIFYAFWRIGNDRNFIRSNISKYRCPECGADIDMNYTKEIVAVRSAEFKKLSEDNPEIRIDIWPPDYICANCKNEYRFEVVAKKILFNRR